MTSLRFAILTFLILICQSSVKSQEQENWVIFSIGSTESRFQTPIKDLYETLTNNGVVKPENIYILTSNITDRPAGIPISGNGSQSDLSRIIREINRKTETNGKRNFVMPILIGHGNSKHDELSRNKSRGKAPIVPVVTDEYSDYYDSDARECDDKVLGLRAEGVAPYAMGLNQLEMESVQTASYAYKAYGLMYTATPTNIQLPDGTIINDTDTTSERKNIYKIKYFLNNQFDSDKDFNIDAGKVTDFINIRDDIDEKVKPADYFKTLISDEVAEAEIIEELDYDDALNGKRIFAVKKDGEYIPAIHLGEETDVSTMAIHGLDEDNQGLFDWMDWNMDGDVNDILSYQGTFTMGTVNVLDVYLASTLSTFQYADLVFVCMGQCFAGEIHDNYYGENKITFGQARYNEFTYGERNPEAIISAFTKEGDYFRVDKNHDKLVTSLELVQHAYEINPEGFRNYFTKDIEKIDKFMSVNATNNRDFTYVKDLAGTEDEKKLEEAIIIDENPIPDNPMLLSPQNNLADTDLEIELSWTKPEYSYYYSVQVASDSSFENILAKSENQKDTTFSLSGLEEDTQYYWRAYAASINGGSWSGVYTFTTFSSTGLKNNFIPTEFTLSQNYPNPFNPTTTIKYSIPSIGAPPVHLRIYDILGKEIATLQDGPQPPGYYERTWNAENMSSGIYFYILSVGQYSEARKMILIK